MSVVLPRATLHRLQRDMKQLQKEPLAGANAEPTEEDISLWNGVIHITLDINGKECVALLHFRIDFPREYPNKAPNVGFSTNFPYRMGASHIEQNGRLAGCQVVCLDLLGNFSGIHTEWATSEGSGWSPAYGVQTLLVNLQSVIGTIGASMSLVQRKSFYERCQLFAQQHPDQMCSVETMESLQSRNRQINLHKRLLKMVRGNLDLVQRATNFVERNGFLNDDDQVNEFVSILKFVAQSTEIGNCDLPKKTGLGTIGNGNLTAKRIAIEKPEVDENIVCYSTGKLYTETILGFGISVHRRGRQVNLHSPGELLSVDAYDAGLRQSTSKAPFEFFLPAFINPKHASKNVQWVQRLHKVVLQLGKLYNCLNLKSSALVVFPKLINTMLVDIMSPETSKSAAIAYFEALLSFWRTFHFLLVGNPQMADQCRHLLERFVEKESARLKDTTPDIGALFALYSSCPNQSLPFKDFIAAYVDEAYVRSALYWKRNQTALDEKSLYVATEIGRNIAMFQSLFVRYLVGADSAAMAIKMDASNGKLPEKLTELQNMWRRHLKETNNWSIYFRRLGLHGDVGKPICADIRAWALRCVDRANGRGPAYGGRGGGGRNQRNDRSCGYFHSGNRRKGGSYYNRR